MSDMVQGWVDQLEIAESGEDRKRRRGGKVGRKRKHHVCLVDEAVK